MILFFSKIRESHREHVGEYSLISDNIYVSDIIYAKGTNSVESGSQKKLELGKISRYLRTVYKILNRD